jgi:hypothetical protein
MVDFCSGLPAVIAGALGAGALGGLEIANAGEKL